MNSTAIFRIAVTDKYHNKKLLLRGVQYYFLKTKFEFYIIIYMYMHVIMHGVLQKTPQNTNISSEHTHTLPLVPFSAS